MKKTTTQPYDSAEYLDSPEAMAAYLGDALASGSTAEFHAALKVVVRARGMTGNAGSTDPGLEDLHNALRADAHPSFDTVQRVLAALGLQLEVHAVA